MEMKKVAVVTSRQMKKSGGIQTSTETLFGGVYPILLLEDIEYEDLKGFEKIIFSGFDTSFMDLARKLKENAVKIAIFWHFSTAIEVDGDVGEEWRAVLQLQKEKIFDLFVTCKYGMNTVIEKMFKIPAFLIENNAMENEFKSIAKEGIGIYSGSSDYWAKNLRPNLYGALMTGRHVDVLPYEETLEEFVRNLGVTEQVTGSKERLEHKEFLRRLSSREIVTYVTFTEGAPIMPLEALNNGTLCITGNNHHYFRNDVRLHELLVCNRPDDPEAIYRAIEKTLNNKVEILQRYQLWKEGYNKKQEENFLRFCETIARM